MRRWRSRLALLAACLAMLWLGRPSALGASHEYPIKAAFIYNFAQFVEWPSGAFADAKAPLAIGILGQDPFDGALDRAVTGKTVGGHPMVVRHFAGVQDLKFCHVLFVPMAVQDQFADVEQKIGTTSVLTVGEADCFTDAGGAIRLYTDANHVRFDISRGAAERAHLHISAKLLRLAKSVVD